MHKHEKISFEPTEDFAFLPLPRIATVDCPQCRYRIPVPNEYTDWKAVAETYRTAYERMTKGFFDLLKEAGEQFDAPLVEYFEASRATLLAELKNTLEELERGNQ